MEKTKKKRVDSRVKHLIENCSQMRHRAILVIIGDKSRDLIAKLHTIISNNNLRTGIRSSPVLWCYKNDLGFSSNKKKRFKQIKKEIHRGLRDPDINDDFELFLTTTYIRFCYYRESHQILGQTFGMCVLQDFEALTPNLLARTIETVQGGGLIIFLLSTMSNLQQLYDVCMDIHSNFKTEIHNQIQPLFNQRFIKSLSSCPNCLIVDDEMNIIPHSSHSINLSPIDVSSNSSNDIDKIKESFDNIPPLSSLLPLCLTMDQSQSLLVCTDNLNNDDVQSIVAITAARGRGKSALLGLSLSVAIFQGFSSIFVTSPHPDNVKTLFELCIKGLKSLGYIEHQHFSIIQSLNPEWQKAIIRLNIFKDHRQTIQYITPYDYQYLRYCEVLVIDEAASIPLPLIQRLFGPYTIFLSSTVNGYEGTGRSLSLKLLSSLRKQSATSSQMKYHELILNEPIRYNLHDPVEEWLSQLLCLDCTGSEHRIVSVLFSFHPSSEKFLQRLMSLFVTSHYKNSPNDLQLLSDAPAHHLFVLLGPSLNTNTLPDIYCAIQICLEGGISSQVTLDIISRGEKPPGDLIPWTISQQYQENTFTSLFGARIMRIAVHPDLQHMHYGSRALSLLASYYQGQIPCQSSISDNETLLYALNEISPPSLSYLGTSFGVTLPLFNFWSKNQYIPVYLRQTPNEITGEHSIIMLLEINSPSNSWLHEFSFDFKNRFIHLLSGPFKHLSLDLALTILSPHPSLLNRKVKESSYYLPLNPYDWSTISSIFSPHDLKRLDSYSHHLVDYHLVIDMINTLAQLFFKGHLPSNVTLNYLQTAIFLSVGLQHQSIDDTLNHLNTITASSSNTSHQSQQPAIAINQILANLHCIIRKINKGLKQLQEIVISKELSTTAITPTTSNMEASTSFQDSLFSSSNPSSYQISKITDNSNTLANQKTDHSKHHKHKHHKSSKKAKHNS